MYIDGAHPTQGFHQILAKKIAEQLAAGQTITRPWLDSEQLID